MAQNISCLTLAAAAQQKAFSGQTLNITDPSLTLLCPAALFRTLFSYFRFKPTCTTHPFVCGYTSELNPALHCSVVFLRNGSCNIHSVTATISPWHALNEIRCTRRSRPDKRALCVHYWQAQAGYLLEVLDLRVHLFSATIQTKSSSL